MQETGNTNQLANVTYMKMSIKSEQQQKKNLGEFL